MDTPWLHLRAALAVVSSCAVVAGCGGTSGPPRVSLSLLAPTDGASVAVRDIDVVGSVDPRNARVVIAGRRARVVAGGFKRPLFLARRVTRIGIVASAPGYLPTTMRVTVLYSADRHTTLPAPPGSGLSSFTARVDRLCAALDSAIAALPAATSPSILFDDTHKQFAIDASYLPKFQAITPPRSVAADYAAFIALGRRGVQLEAQMVADLQARNVAEARRLATTVLAMNAQSDELANRMGLPDCAANPTPSG